MISVGAVWIVWAVDENDQRMSRICHSRRLYVHLISPYIAWVPFAPKSPRMPAVVPCALWPDGDSSLPTLLLQTANYHFDFHCNLTDHQLIINWASLLLPSLQESCRANSNWPTSNCRPSLSRHQTKPHRWSPKMKEFIQPFGYQLSAMLATSQRYSQAEAVTHTDGTRTSKRQSAQIDHHKYYLWTSHTPIAS